MNQKAITSCKLLQYFHRIQRMNSKNYVSFQALYNKTLEPSSICQGGMKMASYDMNIHNSNSKFKKARNSLTKLLNNLKKIVIVV